MSKILEIISKETNGKSFKSFKYSFEGIEVPTLSYDDHEITWERYGETEYIEKSKSLIEEANKLKNIPPIFTYFLDGSRRTFKVDDISYKNQVFPIIAGQIGVGCCERRNKKLKQCLFNKKLVIALPTVASQDDWQRDVFFANLCKEINEDSYLKKNNISFSDILKYSVKKGEEENLENKGIAVIQDLMIQTEIDMVTELVKNKKLNSRNYLLKDGSLEYRVDNFRNNTRELNTFKNNYTYVVGVSKSFNPVNCHDKNKKNNSNSIAELPLFHRTPVNLYTSPRLNGMKYAVWYLRIRERKYTYNTFDGILKIEKILVNDKQQEEGLDTEEVDFITANIINERNPTCYGNDLRWANHLYPVYMTEMYIKSKYMSNTMFLNLF